MPICDYCRPWCATSRAQLAQRQVNMREFPKVKPHICPQCGGTEWATTDAQIQKDEPA